MLESKVGPGPGAGAGCEGAGRAEATDSPGDLMSRAYREEFARLMGQQQVGGGGVGVHPGGPGLLKGPGLPPGFLPNPLFSNPDLFPRPPGPADLQQALSLYQEELSRLQQTALASAIKEQSEQREGERQDSRATPSSEEVEIKKESGGGKPGGPGKLPGYPCEQVRNPK